MKTTTLLALVAAATLGYATPVPEQQAEAAEQGQQSEAGAAEKGMYPPSGDPSWGGDGGYPPHGGSYPPAPQPYDPAPVPPPHPVPPPPHPYGGAPPPPLPYGGGPPYDPGVPPYDPGHPLPPPACGGGPCGGPPACGDPWCGGLPPPPPGLPAWPINGFPSGSLLNNGGLQQFAGDCSAQQQALSCCNGDDNSGGLLGGLLPSGGCGFDLFSDHCNQHVACCDTNGGGLLTIGGLCQLISL